MAKTFYQATKMAAGSLELAFIMDDILKDYADQGYDLSVRQLFYQLVTKNIIENTERSYKRVGSILGDARMNGYIDWDMIVDRGREVVENSHWGSPSEIIATCAQQFRYDIWEDQPYHVEVMVEKQALQGVLEPVCKRWDIPFTANKGYSSLSALHEAGKRMESKLDDGKSVVVIYLGDHDPSGIDMTRDVRDRVAIFSSSELWQPDVDRQEAWKEEAYRTRNPRRFVRYGNAAHKGQTFAVDRIALNMDQVKERDIPPNPAKMSDSRAGDYVARFGDDSWELDAIEPSELVTMVDDAVEIYLDRDLYDAALSRQSDARDTIQELADGMAKS